MGKRREAREAALQFLFGRDLPPAGRAVASAREKGGASRPGEPQQPAAAADSADHEDFWELRPAEPDVRRFCDQIVAGVLENQEKIDAILKKAAANYELNRITTVDRNILRIAIYEMLFRDEIPPVVSINEAIEIAKRFSTEESGRFVNGILDRVKKDLQRPLREPVSNADAD
jgi:N utilization substance protein B